jgi:predicted amidophosphoribosyltransferase
MQCENIVDGKPCNTNLLTTENFCPECGCDVKLDSVKTQPCRKCQFLVQIFHHIFMTNKINYLIKNFKLLLKFYSVSLPSFKFGKQILFQKVFDFVYLF